MHPAVSQSTALPPETRRRRSFRKRMLFSVVSTVFVLAMTEAIAFVGLCVANQSVVSWPSLQEQRREVLSASAGTDLNAVADREFGIVHPYIGYVVRPDYPITSFSDVEPVMSPLGFPSLDATPTRQRSDDTVIIGITGGSVAKWFALDGAADLTQQLNTMPGFSDRTIIVTGLANGGYKQPQQLMAVNYVLSLGAEFDVIINIDGFNEVALHQAGNGPKGIFPAFPKNWFLRVGQLTSPQLLRLVGKTEHLRTERAELAGRASRSPWRFLMLSNLWWRLRDTSLSQQISDTLAQFQKTETTIDDYIQSGPARWDTDECSDDQFLTDVWKRSSLQMHHLCQGQGTAYLHFLQPNQYVPDSKPLSEWELINAYDAEHPYRPGVERGYPLLRAAGEELIRDGVAFEDLTQLFHETDDATYRDDCCHLAETGNTIMAQRIARAVFDAIATDDRLAIHKVSTVSDGQQ